MTIDEIRMKCATVLDGNPSEFEKQAATALIFTTSKLRIIAADHDCVRKMPCAHCSATNGLKDIEQAFQ